MRESMARLTPQFSANRAVREYTERHYLPAAAAYRERAADKGAMGAHMVELAPHSRRSMARAALRRNEGRERWRTGTYSKCRSILASSTRMRVGMELYAEGVDGTGPAAVTMMRLRQEQDAARWYVYSAQVSATRPAADYTARLIPRCPGVAVPLEAARILWQR